MNLMLQNLEKMIDIKKQRNFKSEGERRIAYFLDSNSIKYQYEPGVLVDSVGQKPRIWYPDFYLPELGAYIEYYGMAGEQNYDKGIKTKNSAYSKMGLDVISVYPWMFANNWQGHVMKQLEGSVTRRYRNLKAKPYWSQRKTHTYHNTLQSKPGYGTGLRKRY